MTKRWRIRPHDQTLIAALQSQSRVSAVVAQMLAARGLHSAAQVQVFLNPKLNDLREPDQLPGAAEAAERLIQAVRARRPIVVYGDYDADGITGTALLYECLALVGAQVSYYVPHRIDEGYGLHDEALETLAVRGASLVVTVDCGIGSVAQAETARRLGLELIITDHHTPARGCRRPRPLSIPRCPARRIPSPD